MAINTTGILIRNLPETDVVEDVENLIIDNEATSLTYKIQAKDLKSYFVKEVREDLENSTNTLTQITTELKGDINLETASRQEADSFLETRLNEEIQSRHVADALLDAKKLNKDNVNVDVVTSINVVGHRNVTNITGTTVNIATNVQNNFVKNIKIATQDQAGLMSLEDKKKLDESINPEEFNNQINSLNTKVNKEISDRSQADTVIRNQLGLEIVRAQDAESQLQTNIDGIASTIDNLDVQIKKEIVDRESADSILDTIKLNKDFIGSVLTGNTLTVLDKAIIIDTSSIDPSTSDQSLKKTTITLDKHIEASKTGDNILSISVPEIGDMGLLSTESKDTLVNAINDVNAKEVSWGEINGDIVNQTDLHNTIEDVYGNIDNLYGEIVDEASIRHSEDLILDSMKLNKTSANRQFNVNSITQTILQDKITLNQTEYNPVSESSISKSIDILGASNLRAGLMTSEDKIKLNNTVSTSSMEEEISRLDAEDSLLQDQVNNLSLSKLDKDTFDEVVTQISLGEITNNKFDLKVNSVNIDTKTSMETSLSLPKATATSLGLMGPDDKTNISNSATKSELQQEVINRGLAVDSAISTSKLYTDAELEAQYQGFIDNLASKVNTSGDNAVFDSLSTTAKNNILAFTMALPVNTENTIGQIKFITSAIDGALSMPSGGTWAILSSFSTNYTTAAVYDYGSDEPTSFVVAGGTQIRPGRSGYVQRAYVIRIQ